MKNTLVALGILSLITVLFSLTAWDQWWIRIFDYPREQIALASTVVLVLSVLALAWRKTWVKVYLALLALGVGYQLYVLAPYTAVFPEAIPARAAAAPGQEVALMVANVKMDNREADSFLALVDEYDPDVILVMEPDAWWNEQLQPLAESYPHTLEQPQDNYYGISLYSRLPLEEAEIRYIQYEDVPAVYAVLSPPGGQAIVFYGLHPRPPLPDNSVTAADRELFRVARQVQDRSRPVIVAGDFNDVPWSYTVETFQQISGLDGLRVGRGFYNTYDAHNPLLQMPLDHIFLSEELEVARFERLPAYSSDHFALLARVLVSETTPAR